MAELVGLRVLVVEDEAPVALMIEDMLEEAGCTIAGSVARLADALKIAATVEIDLALLDVNLAGQSVFPVADILRGRRIPLVFSTGYGARGLPSQYAGFPVLGKPFSANQLRQTIATAVGLGRERV
jgi:CheY-like chemotaxis protein